MTSCKDYDHVDIAVVGAGPAGLSAGMYGARAGLDTVIFGDPYAGQLAKADPVENFITWIESPNGGSPSGLEIIEKMLSHAEKVGAKLVDKEIKQIVKNEDGHFSLIDSDGDATCAYTIILASGTKAKKAGIKNEEDLYGKGVGYCTICDGPLYKDMPVAITGHGDEMVQAALRMATIASELHVVPLRPRIGADPQLITQLESYDNVTLHRNARPIEITSDEGGVSGYTFKHDGHECHVDVKAVFIEVGVLPSSTIASGLGIELDGNFVKVDRTQATNVDGFYAAGDITGGIARQAIVSAGDGARAAITAMDYIKKIGVSSAKIKSVQWGGDSKKSKSSKSSDKSESPETSEVSEKTSSKGEEFSNQLVEYVFADDGFKGQYNRYEVDNETLQQIGDDFKDIKLITVSAHWCPDCRRNVPRMAKISEKLSSWDILVEDRDAEGVREKYDVRKIPTFIFQDSDGNELGRIIENPKYHSLEADIVKLAQGTY